MQEAIIKGSAAYLRILVSPMAHPLMCFIAWVSLPFLLSCAVLFFENLMLIRGVFYGIYASAVLPMRTYVAAGGTRSSEETSVEFTRLWNSAGAFLHQVHCNMKA